jgi:hypothetical protein
MFFFQDDDVFVLLREQCGNGRAGGTTADNNHIAFTTVCHRRCHFRRMIEAPARAFFVASPPTVLSIN